MHRWKIRYTQIALLSAACLALFLGYSQSTNPEKETQLQLAKMLAPETTKKVSATLAPVSSGEPLQQATIDTPTEISIETINVTANVTPVGVDEQYRFQVPEAQTVGWYQYSSPPNTQGTTVLAGHVDFNQEKGVFFNLDTMKKGDTIVVKTASNKVHRYEVTATTSYQKTQLPVEDLFSASGDNKLHLITCGGTFDPDTRSYEGNVVVSATLRNQ